MPLSMHGSLQPQVSVALRSTESNQQQTMVEGMVSMECREFDEE
jgi:hypothetical protein